MVNHQYRTPGFRLKADAEHADRHASCAAIGRSLEGLRLIARLVADDLRAGSPVLAAPQRDATQAAPGRGRRPTRVSAVAIRPTPARAA